MTKFDQHFQELSSEQEHQLFAGVDPGQRMCFFSFDVECASTLGVVSPVGLVPPSLSTELPRGLQPMAFKSRNDAPNMTIAITRMTASAAGSRIPETRSEVPLQRRIRVTVTVGDWHLVRVAARFFRMPSNNSETHVFSAKRPAGWR